ncbi:MAG TPA: zinc ribbon domain-containing protein [Vicinamibacterales bacterium]|nr:zinc ribbon domain-containing protein [Vicinamibacterales bacterium]
MPLYEYECQSCHRRLEKIQKFSDPPLEVCPHCGGRLEKLISSPAFHLKGSGWYATDYAKKSGAPEKAGDSVKSGGSEKSGEAEKSSGSEKSGESEKSDSSTSSKPATDSKAPTKSTT